MSAMIQLMREGSASGAGQGAAHSLYAADIAKQQISPCAQLRPSMGSAP